MFCFCFALVGCGFTPLYGTKSTPDLSVQNGIGFNQIAIDTIPDQQGQYLRNQLIDRFYKNGYPDSPRYHLAIAPIAETEQSLAIAKSTESTRNQLRMATRFELKDKNTGAVMLTRDVVGITSYNILVSEFATRVAEDNARTNALNDLARQIELQLGLYLRRS
jgi:LPS-assembly lipoprotein